MPATDHYRETPPAGLGLSFAVGVVAALGAASVGHWFVAAVAGSDQLRTVYHLIASVQGFVTGLFVIVCCYWLPAATRTRPPSWSLATVAIVAPVVTVVTVWYRFAIPREVMLAISELAWGAALLAVVIIAVPRLRAAPWMTRWAAVWLVVSVVLGVAGACLVSAYSTVIVLRQVEVWWLVFLGRGFLLQGFPLAVIIAAAPALAAWLEEDLPVAGPRARAAPALVAGAVLALSIPVELWLSSFLGLGLRMLVSGWALWPLMRTVSRTVFVRPVVGIVGRSAAYIFLGYGLAALLPGSRSAGLHMVFIGGFTLGLMGVILVWLMADLRSPWPAGFALALEAAMVVRVFSELLRAFEVAGWVVSASLLLVAVVAWAALVVSSLSRRC